MKKIFPKLTLAVVVLAALLGALPAGAETIVVGNDIISRSLYDPNFAYSGITYNHIAVLDRTKPITRDGKLTQFQYYAINTNPFYFVLIDGSDVVQWVSERIIPPGTGANTYVLPTAFPVQSGWYFGAYLMPTSTETGTSVDGTIPFDFDLANGSEVGCQYNGELPSVGQLFGQNDVSKRTYSFAVTVVTAEAVPGQSVQVNIVKYLDNKEADATTAQNNSFPIFYMWGHPTDTTVGGSGTFYLDPAGANTGIPYEAKSPVMPSGSYYTLSETTSGTAVGPNCASGQFSKWVGYTTGDNLGQAKTATISTSGPALEAIAANKYVIVWNETCKYVNVTVVKYLDGKPADATAAQSNVFPITAGWTDGSGAKKTGTFSLGPTGVNTTSPYQASASLNSGAAYNLAETTNTTAVGAACTGTQFSRLVGYSTGTTLVAAAGATPTASAPNLTNITSDQFVIVWNATCSTGGGGDDDDDCDCRHDNGHHYGNDKGDHHDSDKCDHDDNGHHYGNDMGDHHQQGGHQGGKDKCKCDHDDNGHHYGNGMGDHHDSDKCDHDDNGHHYGNDMGDHYDFSKDGDCDDKDKHSGKR